MSRHAATGVVLLLLVGTAVAFAETERLKLKPTAIEESFVQTAFSPVCGCAQAHAVIRLRLHRADTVDVGILDPEGETVRVLAERRRLPRGRTQLVWDGRDDHGSRVPDGTYGVKVHLFRVDRTFRLPQQTVLDTVAPSARYVSSSGPAKPGRRFRIFYHLSEPAHGVLFVNGRRAIVTHTKLRSAKLDWRPQRRGRYRLQLAAVDLAGNLGPRSRAFFVGVR